MKRRNKIRIIAKNHDYYDAIQRMGTDPTIIYLRKEVEYWLPHGSWNFPNLPYIHNYDSIFRPFNVSNGVVGFCGEIHPFIEVNWTADNKPQYIHFYDFDTFDAWAKANLPPNRYKKWREMKPGKSRIFRNFCPPVIIDFFFVIPKKEWDIYFEEHPLFVTYNTYRPKICYNDELKKVEFFKVYDAVTAFQKLAMYMANRAIHQKEMPLIPDDLKISTHGFDKYSFRKEKKSPARKSK